MVGGRGLLYRIRRASLRVSPPLVGFLIRPSPISAMEEDNQAQDNSISVKVFVSTYIRINNPCQDEEIDTNWDEAIETFDNMELREELLRGIYA